MPSNNDNCIFLYDIDDSSSNIITFGSYSIAYYISKDKSKTSTNEDVLFAVNHNDLIILGVSDGAGGHPRGNDAAYIVGQEVIKALNNLTADNLDMIKIIETINNEVINLKAGARCTLAMAVIAEDTFKCYSVGDSEVVYWNSIGREIYSNIPQSITGYSVEAGVIPQEEALDDPDRHYVDNMIGDEILRIEALSKINIKKGHMAIIGTDGLFDNLSHNTIKETISAGTFEESFNSLVTQCTKKDSWKKHDDIAFIMIRKTLTNE